MAIVQGIKRIDPLDLNKNVTIGVAFPLDESNMFKGTNTVAEQVKANLINLLLTVPGERINLPNYGVGLKNLLFEQSIDLETLKEQIISTTNRYIPNIKIKNIQTGMTKDEHTIYIKVAYVSTLNGEPDSIQLNFN
jgi:phage baseplate assembly protein W